MDTDNMDSDKDLIQGSSYEEIEELKKEVTFWKEHYKRDVKYWKGKYENLIRVYPMLRSKTDAATQTETIVNENESQ